ncbi:MAG TPA: tail fiber domain-containing protein [Pyrinomonadaceae bacterium]|jgi:hypothetical protein
MTTKKAPKQSSKQSSERAKAGDDTSCLLDYRPSTYPTPIQTGSAQTPARAVLNTAALPGAGQKVYCNQIVISVPVGSDAADLFQQTPTTSVNTDKWSVTSTLLKTGREVGIEDEGDYATFIFECRDASDYLIDYSLVFGISGAVSPVPSPCVVQIMENSGTTKDPSTFTSKTCSYTLTTSTPIFYLTNFVATAAGSPTVPATEFADGADINFAWESSGTFYQLFEKNQPKPVYAGTQTAFTLKGGVKTDTTFVLVAMVSGDPGGDKPQSGYQPIYIYDALTVTVSNPALAPSALNVSGHAGVGTLGVTGLAELTNADVRVLLNVTGATDLADTNVKGSLGIGVPAPRSKLHVNSNDGIRLGLEQNGGGQLVITNNAGDDSIYLEAVSKDGIDKGGKGAAKKLYLGTPGGPNMADLPTLVLHAASTAVHGSLGVGLGETAPQNALDVKGGVVIGATYAGTQKAPGSGLKVEGAVILNNDLAVENGVVTVKQLQFLGPTNWTEQTQSGTLQITNKSGLAAKFEPDLSCWFQGPVSTGSGFYSAGPILLYDPGENAWRRLSFAKDSGYQWATLVPHATPSDLRLKSEVQPVPSALEKIRRLSGVTFRWNNDALQHFTRDIETTISAGPNATEREHHKVWQTERGRRRDQLAATQVGIVAQDVEAVLPEAVTTDEAGYKSVRYDNLIPLLIEAVKEQDLALTAQAALAARQQTEIERLKQPLLSADPPRAQDVEAVVPEAVSENEDGHKCARYPQLVALLVEAIKEQGSQIQALSSEVSALGERLRDKLSSVIATPPD